MSADPFLRSNSELDEHVRERLADLVQAARTGLGERLLAVVLGGSLARGQGMALRRRHGGVVLLSDIDLYFVVRAPIAPPAAAKFLTGAIRSLRSDSRLLAPPDLAIVGEDYFVHGRRQLIHAQLRHGARFLWPEDPQLVADMRRTWSLETANDLKICAEDAQRLVLNRCAEWWLVAEGDPCLAAVHRMKQWMDAPLSWLASAGRYHPSRTAQSRLLEDIESELPGDVRAAWSEGLEIGRGWVSRAREEVLEEDGLLSAARSHAAGDPLDDPIRQWVWPFVRCAWQGEKGASVEALGQALAAGRPGPEDRALAQRWLRREPLHRRWRAARRWAPLSPRRLRPWWLHAYGGTGIDRLWVACAWAYAGLDGGRSLLQGLSAADDVSDVPSDWARWWASWFLGEGRR